VQALGNRVFPSLLADVSLARSGKTSVGRAIGLHFHHHPECYAHVVFLDCAELVKSPLSHIFSCEITA
jgi:hypothetical protein